MAIASCYMVNSKTMKHMHLMEEIEKVTWQLPNNRKYLIGIDQSSSCTGLYVTDEEMSFHLMVDVFRRGQEKYRYYENLRLFLCRTLEGCTVSMVCMEDLPPYKYQGMGKVLLELRGVVSTWYESIPEFRAVPEENRVKVHPSTWKSKMIDKRKGTNRMNIKVEMALDISEKIPALEPYFRKCPSKDYDSFDAVGIVHGYLASHFKNGQAVIAGAKDYYGDIYTFFRILSKEEFSSNKRLEGFEPQQHKHGVKVLRYNEELSLIDNIKRAASKHPFVVTIISDPMASLAVRWQNQMGMGEGIMLAYIVRKSAITSKVQLEVLKEYLGFEEIRGR